MTLPPLPVAITRALADLHDGYGRQAARVMLAGLLDTYDRPRYVCSPESQEYDQQVATVRRLYDTRREA